jgi:hypothetical protein
MRSSWRSDTVVNFDTSWGAGPADQRELTDALLAAALADGRPPSGSGLADQEPSLIGVFGATAMAVFFWSLLLFGCSRAE